MKLHKHSFHHYIATRYGGWVDTDSPVTMGDYLVVAMMGKLIVTLYGILIWFLVYLFIDPIILNHYFYDLMLELTEQQLFIAIYISLLVCIVSVLIFNATLDKLKSRKATMVTFED